MPPDMASKQPEYGQGMNTHSRKGVPGQDFQLLSVRT